MPIVRTPTPRPVILCAVADLSRAAVQQKILVRAGFAVTYSPSADEAVRTLASRRVDLVLICGLPAQEERILVRAARDHGLPVVAMGSASPVPQAGVQVVGDSGNLIPRIRQVLTGLRAAA